MVGRLWLKLCFIALIALVGNQTRAQSASSVYNRVSGSVGIVLVSTFEGQLVASGSAVIVAPQTMVTNHHVLLSGHRYQVYVSGHLYEAYMTSCDSTQDLCLLDVKKLEASPVEFGDANQVAVGDTVYTLGAPNEIANIVGVSQVTKQKSYSPPQLTLSNGLITALRQVEDSNVIQTNAAISPGSSGGGLFDANGRLLGITSFAMKNGQSLNMALPVNWVARLGVTGAPHASEPLQAESVSSAFPTQPAETSSNSDVRQARETADATQMQIKGTVTTLPQNPGGQARSGFPVVYAASGIALLIALILFMRRRRVDDATIYGDTSTADPADSNPLWQSCLQKAQEELEQNKPDPALWHAVTRDNKGNMAVARQDYIQRRATRLLSAEKDRVWAEAARQNQGS